MEKEQKNIVVIKNLDELQEVWQNKLNEAESVDEDDIESDFIDWQKYLYERQTLYGVDRFNYKYFKTYYSSWGTLTCFYIPVLTTIDVSITKHIERIGIDKAEVPIIPICEYKLVPTGRVIISDIKKYKDYKEKKEYFDKFPPPKVKFKKHKRKSYAELLQLKQNTIAEYYDNYKILTDNEYERFIPQNTKKIYILPIEYMLKNMRNGYYETVAAARAAAIMLATKYRVERKYFFILEYWLMYTGDFEIYDPALTPSARKEYRRNRTEKGRARVWRGHQKRKEKEMAEKALKEKEKKNEGEEDT